MRGSLSHPKIPRERIKATAQRAMADAKKDVASALSEGSIGPTRRPVAQPQDWRPPGSPGACGTALTRR